MAHMDTAQELIEAPVSAEGLARHGNDAYLAAGAHEVFHRHVGEAQASRFVGET